MVWLDETKPSVGSFTFRSAGVFWPGVLSRPFNCDGKVRDSVLDSMEAPPRQILIAEFEGVVMSAIDCAKVH
jgi:hypothetical protein